MFIIIIKAHLSTSLDFFKCHPMRKAVWNTEFRLLSFLLSTLSTTKSECHLYCFTLYHIRSKSLALIRVRSCQIMLLQKSKVISLQSSHYHGPLKYAPNWSQVVLHTKEHPFTTETVWISWKHMLGAHGSDWIIMHNLMRSDGIRHKAMWSNVKQYYKAMPSDMKWYEAMWCKWFVLFCFHSYSSHLLISWKEIRTCTP